MDNKILSVLITTYNQDKYIAKTIDSVLAQEDCPDFEIIIGDDASDDATGEIIKSYIEKYSEKIRYIRQEKNLGMLNNLKTCFEACSGEYIALCEGDDYWCDRYKLKKQYEALVKDEAANLCFSNMYVLNGNHKRNDITKLPIQNKDKISAEDFIKTKNPIGNFSCCMYRKKALNSIPNAYWNNKKMADFAFNLLVLSDSPYAIYLNEPMSVYRILNNSISHKNMHFKRVLDLILMLSETNTLTNYRYEELIKDWLELLISKQKYRKRQYSKLLGCSFRIKKRWILLGLGIS